MVDAQQRWKEMLEGWAIPTGILDAAPASPYFFDPAVFIAAADDALARTEDSPSDRVARDALPERGTVLDVGSGAGAASLRLDPAHVTAVDPSPLLLEAFSARAEARGIAHAEFEGVWPDVASRVPDADVAVCHHVVYNVADLASFASALASHAHRVVVELTAVHPMAWMAPYWEALHGLVQPQRPTADDAADVIAALGFDVQQVRWQRPIQMIGEGTDHQVARIARRLCLRDDRLPELRRVLEQAPPPTVREVVTFWW
jgi:SAM-dependent methyltransferase